MFQPIEDVSLLSRVLESIRDAVFEGLLRPGDSLVELDLARKFKVSQTTVRQALMKLEHADLVSRTPNRRTEVRNLTRDEVKERIEIRILLEKVACVKAAGRMTASDMDELERLAARIAEENCSRADAQFHQYIWQLAENRTLYETLDQLTAPLFAFVNTMRRAGLQNRPERVEAHRVLLKALRESDPSAIRRLVAEHIQSAYQSLCTRSFTDFRTLAEQIEQRASSSILDETHPRKLRVLG